MQLYTTNDSQMKNLHSLAGKGAGYGTYTDVKFVIIVNMLRDEKVSTAEPLKRLCLNWSEEGQAMSLYQGVGDVTELLELLFTGPCAYNARCFGS